MRTTNDETTVRPLHPFWYVPVSLAAGLATSGPLAGAALYRYGYRRLGWGLGCGLALAGTAILLFGGLWGMQWQWVCLTVSGIHLVCGTALFLALRRPHREFLAARPETAEREKGDYRHIITGMVGGALVAGLFGTVLSIVFVLLDDRVFSTMLPVAPDDFMVVARVLQSAAFITLAAIAAGGFLGRLRPKTTPGEVFLFSIFLVWAHLTWLLCVDAAIVAPAFQARSATLPGWGAMFFPTLPLELLVGCWWTVFALFFIIASPGLTGVFLRAALVFFMNAAAAIVLSITFGYSADLLLDLGKHLEKEARIPEALRCYELGLKKEPKEQIASYLQYRIALLNHKLGWDDKARQGFERVVAKYTGNEILVKRAGRFLDNMERRPIGKRVALAGVETRTEYKGGYCVPNSLALVMKYWGHDIPARIIGRRITGLGSGTIVVDQAWFAEQEGLRHDFLPLAGIDDIKRCIDAGFPVLVYVPLHVFAIVGYDDLLETFVTYDVATMDIWEEYLQKDFIKSWKKQAAALVLCYPPEKEGLVPGDIRRRLENLSDKFLHFQLYRLDAPMNSISIPHLSKSAGTDGTFFFPVTVLYDDVPGLRASVGRQFDADQMAERIKAYFWNDFDEGRHEAGQHHDETSSRPDWLFGSALSYLIGNERFDLAEALVSRINDQGQVSKQTLAEVGLVDLSRGEFRRGLDRLQNGGKTSAALYAGLAKLRIGNERDAAQDLVKVIEANGCGCPPRGAVSGMKAPHGVNESSAFYDRESALSLDEYGFPAAAIANGVLAGMSEYGESRETLESHWEARMQQLPFDARVGASLARLYQARLSKLDPEKDQLLYSRLTRKQALLADRVKRYQRPASPGE